MSKVPPKSKVRFNVQAKQDVLELDAIESQHKRSQPPSKAKLNKSNDSDSDDYYQQSKKVMQSGKKKTIASVVQHKHKQQKERQTGRFNAQYTNEVTVQLQLQDTSQQFRDHQSVIMNNKEIIRAAIIGSELLLNNTVTQEYKISSLYQRWGPENSFNALEVIFQNNNVDMLEQFCKIAQRKIVFADMPQYSFQEFYSGHRDQQQQRVSSLRGIMQGYDAFTSDQLVEHTITQQTLLNLLMNPFIVNTQLYEILWLSGALNVELQNYIFKNIPIAVRAGNHKVAQYLIEKALTTQNPYGYTGLHAECLGNYENRVAMIRKNDCTFKISGEMSIAPLHIAAINPDIQYLKKMVELCQDHNIKDELGRKPIHYAAVSESNNCLQFLIEQGADTEEKDSQNNTPLMLASQYGRLSCVRLLLENCKENIHKKNSKGYAAIHLAAQYGHINCLEELIANGAEPKLQNSNHSQPLHLASAYGHYEIVKYLKEKQNASINSTDQYGRTPLVMAARNGNLKILSYLLKNGANYNINDSSGNSPMHYAAAYGFPECLVELKRAGHDLRVQYSWHGTPLFIALVKNHFSIVQDILEYTETKVDFKDCQGKTLLISSLEKFEIQYLDFIQHLIIKRKAIVTEQDQLNRTALHYAVQLSQNQCKLKIHNYSQMPKVERRYYKQRFSDAIFEIVQLLMRNGANINCLDSFGVTPFMISIQQKQTNLIHYFIDNFDPNYAVKDSSDKNILHLMIDNGSYIHPERSDIFQKILCNSKREQIYEPEEQGFPPLVYMIKEFTQNTSLIYKKNFHKMIINQQQADINSEEENKIGFPYSKNEKLHIQTHIYTLDQQDVVLNHIIKFLKCGATLTQHVKKNKKYRKHNQNYVTHDNPYNSDSKKLIWHFLFQYLPHKQFFLKLFDKLKKNLNEELNEKYLKGNLGFNFQTQNGQTPLHLFCLYSMNSKIYNCTDTQNLRKQFLNYALDTLKIDIEVKDKDGRTATHIVAVNYEESILDILLKNKGQVNTVCKNNIVPLIYHINNQNVQVVEQLLDRKANPDYQDLKKRSSLHHVLNIRSTSAGSSYQMENLLLAKGAKLDIRDIFDRTPIFYCFVQIGKENVRSHWDPCDRIQSLLSKKSCSANVIDKFNRNLLHYAALRNAVCSASYLVNKHKDVKLNEVDLDGNTPVALGFLCGHFNFVKTMIDFNAAIQGFAFYNDRKKLEQEYIREQKQLLQGKFIDMDIDFSCVNRTQNQNAYEQIQDDSDDIIFATIFPYIPVPHNIKPAKYTFTKLAILHDWQNIIFWLINSGFDIFMALEDSLESENFSLAYAILNNYEINQIQSRRNKNGMNLYHIFAKFGKSADKYIYQQIIAILDKLNVSCSLTDNFRRTPLHYAAIEGFNILQYYLLNKKVNPNIIDIYENTPFSYAIQIDYKCVLSDVCFFQWLAAGLNIQSKIKVHNRDYKLDTFMYLIQERQNEDESLLNILFHFGSNINALNQDGESALFLSIRQNNIKLLKFLLKESINAQQQSGLYKNMQNETLYHVVVQPFSYGSFENEEMLKIIISSNVFVDINQIDNLGRTPLDYALKQKSGKMANILRQNGGKLNNGFIVSQNAIDIAQFPSNFPDFNYHAQQYIAENMNSFEVDGSSIDPRLQVDQQVLQLDGKYEIYVENGYPYSQVLTKFQLNNKQDSENKFYKIQVIHEMNKNDYILFTRWGRTGTPGQVQMALLDKPNAIKEFHLIFKCKSGNIWEKLIDGQPFKKQSQKYSLLNVEIRKKYKKLITPFNFQNENIKPYPHHNLEINIARFLFDLCQIKLYQRELANIGIDYDFLPLESLDIKQLQGAMILLKELEDIVNDVKQEKLMINFNSNRIFELFELINQRSLRYYQIIPFRDFRTVPPPPLESIQQIYQQRIIIERLSSLEVSSKIFLGAYKYSYQENPLTYCYNAMQIKVATLIKEDPEFQMVVSYAKVTSRLTISNIFAVERKNESERFYSRFQDVQRQLLWHGSKTSNLMAILTQGLKIATSSAYATGSMFGKGIYFADTFEKSYEQTQDHTSNMNRYGSFGGLGGGMFSGGCYGQNNNRQCNNNQTQQYIDEEQNEIQRYRYLLLCEVETGKMKELREPTHVENFQDQYYGFDSIKGCGSSVPDPNFQVLLDDGTILPQGKIIQVKPLNEKDIYHLTHNEYIVYDEAQVRIRYLVQIDTQNQEDKFL